MRKTIAMLTLFLRAVFLYLAVFFILRLTGKRQVADLQPFDLLITLLIADLASCAIANTSIPLTYSLVPILALYLVQQGLTWVCLKSAHLRRVICGSPVILIADGVVAEEAMRLTNYTMIDLLDQLRSKDIFDLSNVAYAILETNGTMSIIILHTIKPRKLYLSDFVPLSALPSFLERRDITFLPLTLGISSVTRRRASSAFKVL